MTELQVPIARHAVVKAPGRLVCVGVGSCVVITVHDPAEQLGALAHVLLPREGDGIATGHPARFASTAVPLLLNSLRARGANGPFRAKIVGGASLFGDVLAPKGGIGLRNAEAAREALAAAGVPIVAEDIGGTSGRSIVFDVETGNVAVRRTGGETSVL